ncbi:hypothetical protein AKJ16_DCAP14830 [Drosera capensis]
MLISPVFYDDAERIAHWLLVTTPAGFRPTPATPRRHKAHKKSSPHYHRQAHAVPRPPWPQISAVVGDRRGTAAAMARKEKVRNAEKLVEEVMGGTTLRTSPLTCSAFETWRSRSPRKKASLPSPTPWKSLGGGRLRKGTNLLQNPLLDCRVLVKKPEEPAERHRRRVPPGQNEVHANVPQELECWGHESQDRCFRGIFKCLCEWYLRQSQLKATRVSSEGYHADVVECQSQENVLEVNLDGPFYGVLQHRQQPVVDELEQRVHCQLPKPCRVELEAGCLPLLLPRLIISIEYPVPE